MRRFSIRAIMTIIVISAVGLAALRNANDWWSGTMLLLSLAATGTGVLGTLFLRGRDRPWWSGYALFSGMYLVLTFAPVFRTEVNPHLATSTALGYVHSKVIASPPISYPRANWWREIAASRTKRNRQTGGIQDNQSLDPVAVPYINIVDPSLDSSPLQPSRNPWRAMLPGAADAEEFARVGHTLFAFVAGLWGGAVAGRFQAKRD